MNGIITQEKTRGANIYGQISSMGHEQLVFCYDEPTGLKAIVAIHNTVLGPAIGGTRMWEYENEEEAISDVLRLSRGMTFKSAISGLNIGGGKAVLIGNQKLKTEAYLRRFGKFIEGLAGRYFTAEDVNMKTSDMEYISMETAFVTGLPEIKGGGGDPSPVTAYGTYLGMKAAANEAYGSDSLNGKKVAVQGIGQVGKFLVNYLKKEGAIVYITDIRMDKLKEVAYETGAIAVDPEGIFDLDMDIYSPCAMGASINDRTLARLKCDVIAGAANNQLLDEELHGQMLLDQGILYAPDFLINAGGIINVYTEYLGNYKRETAYQQTEKIYTTCLEILKKSKKENIPTQQIATVMAWDRIQAIGRLKCSG